MGMYQGPRQEARRINEWLPEEAKNVDGLILSHGHLDHCGKIPVLTQAGYDGPIYCTPATAEVARIVLEDSAEIQEEDANYLNHRQRAPGEEPIRPLYVRSDVPRILKQIRRVKYGQRVDLGKGVGFTLLDAGHILGSAYVIIDWRDDGGGKVTSPVGGMSTSPAPGLVSDRSVRPTENSRTILFTADVGRYNSPIIRDPQTIPNAVDYVITESTYGGRAHAPMNEVGPALLDAVKHCIAHRSRLLVPAFAVGRTQTILWYIQRFIQGGLIGPIPIYVDSPMGVAVSHVHEEFRDYYDQETRDAIGTNDLFGMSRVTFASSTQESKRINGENGPCVIIASSPTCEFGRILHHLKVSIERPNDLVVMVGWTPPHTLGRRLQDGQTRIKIYDRWYDVKCQVRTIHGLSAHADGTEIIKFLAPTIRPETGFYVVHGEPGEADALVGKLLSAGASRVEVPAMGTEVMVR